MLIMPHRHTPKSCLPDIWVLHVLVKLTHKINHHSSIPSQPDTPMHLPKWYFISNEHNNKIKILPHMLQMSSVQLKMHQTFLRRGKGKNVLSDVYFSWYSTVYILCYKISNISTILLLLAIPYSLCSSKHLRVMVLYLVRWLKPLFPKGLGL